jgi:hypothetical protein
MADSMRKRLSLTAFFLIGCVLLGVAAANFFPDQTFRAVTMSRTLYYGIVSRLTPMPSGKYRQIQECRIYESLVREFVGSNRLNRTIFLRVAGADPNDELLAQLTASGLPVQRASEAHFDKSFYAQSVWTDPATGTGVMMIHVGAVSWVFGDTVEVEAGYGCGGLCGAGGVYQVVKKYGAWTVAGSRNWWVS